METITISLSGLTPKIKRHLSVIGKRMYDKEGKNLFSNITTSTAEDPIFEHYITIAAQNIAATLDKFVTAYSDTSVTVQSERWSTQVKLALKSAAESYALLFTVGEFLAMTHPDLAKKYQEDAVGTMTTIIETANNKVAPTQNSSTHYNNVTGSVSETNIYPEFDKLTTGYYYLKGKILTIDNPIVYVNVESHEIEPADGEEILFGCLFSFKEDKMMTVAEPKETPNLLTQIRSAALNAITNVYNMSDFNTPSTTQSHNYVITPIGFIKLS